LVISSLCSSFSALASPATATTLLVAAPATLSAPAPTVVDRAGEWLVGSGYHRPFADHQHALLDQRPGDSQPCAGEDAGEGRPGNAHPFRGSFLVEPLEVGESQSLKLVESQLFDFKPADRTADGFERPAFGPASDPPDLLRSCHFASQLRTYVHYS
jgi:hypothetical protein